MAIMFTPAISAANYQAFREIINGDLPDTYDEWLQLANKRSLENIGMGHVSQPVDVDPSEFARFLKSVGPSANLHWLYNFAQQKGSGHSY